MGAIPSEPYRCYMNKILYPMSYFYCCKSKIKQTKNIDPHLNTTLIYQNSLTLDLVRTHMKTRSSKIVS